MNDFKSLRVLDRFKGIFEKLNIDYELMRKILQLKLTMDSRRIPTIFNGSRVKKEGNQFVKSLWIYVLFGLLMLTPFLFLGNQFIFFTSIMFSIIMFILLTSMVSDFSAVLLDIRDKHIIHTKPISNRTINAAKMVHILIYLFLLGGSFVLIPIIVSVLKHGIIFTLIFAVELVLISCLVVVLTAFVYLFILHFFSGEKLKDVINYVQILLSLGIMIGYQLVIRAFEFVDIDISYTFAWWHLLLPPIWYGAPYELIIHRDFSLHFILLTIFAVLGPILSVFLYIRLMPTFERNLVKLLSDSKRTKKKPRKLEQLWAKIVCRTKEERLFFSFASLMMKQERELKLKIYPQLGFALIFPLIFLFNDVRTRPFEEVRNGSIYLVIYFCTMMIPTVIHMLKYSGTYKGQWIYRAAPIQNKASIYSATLKACIVHYFLPIFLILSVLFVWIFSSRILLDLFVVLLVAIAVTLLSYRMLNGEEYPFSSSHEHAQNEGTLKALMAMALIGLFIIIHIIASKIPYGLYGYAIVLIIAIPIGWKIVFPKQLKKYA